jgi:hypothetical protein
MTQGVVDLFEVIHIEQHEADPPAVAAALPQRLVKTLLEQPPVRQHGHGIVMGAPTQALLVLLLKTDVVDDALQKGRRSRCIIDALTTLQDPACFPGAHDDAIRP